MTGNRKILRNLKRRKRIFKGSVSQIYKIKKDKNDNVDQQVFYLRKKFCSFLKKFFLYSNDKYFIYLII